MLDFGFEGVKSEDGSGACNASNEELDLTPWEDSRKFENGDGETKQKRGRSLAAAIR